MRTIRLLSFIGIVAVGFVVRSFGQTTVVQPATQPAAVVDIAQQPSCPVQIVVNPDRPMGMAALKFRVQNNSTQPIKGYVLIYQRGASKMTNTSIIPQRPIEPGKTDTGGIGTQQEEKISLSVDHVLFADGSTWGEDVYGRSKLIADYIAGQDLAIERLRELVGAGDPADFLDEIKRSGGYSIGSPVDMVQTRFDKEQRQKGYTDVLSMLRKMKKRTAEAQELARKLELMETPAN